MLTNHCPPPHWLRCAGLLTLTIFAFTRLKLKRPQTVKKFRAEIDRMYAEIKAQAGLAKSKL
jgi:hypothetical protein